MHASHAGAGLAFPLSCRGRHVGALVAIGSSFVFAIDSVGVHALMTALLAAMIGLLVFFITVTDRPYRGASGIGPDAYELILRDLVAPAVPPVP